ncbi:MAG TPA: hypothetical protein VGL27_13075 [Negativicutes bacterium]|jgi:hypothetical protein
MSDDIVRSLIEKIDSMAIDVAIIKTKISNTENMNLEERIRTLEGVVNQWTGSKVLLLWLITTGIAVFAAFKH